MTEPEPLTLASVQEHIDNITSIKQKGLSDNISIDAARALLLLEVNDVARAVIENHRIANEHEAVAIIEACLPIRTHDDSERFRLALEFIDGQ